MLAGSIIKKKLFKQFFFPFQKLGSSDLNVYEYHDVLTPRTITTHKKLSTIKVKVLQKLRRFLPD